MHVRITSENVITDYMENEKSEQVCHPANDYAASSHQRERKIYSHFIKNLIFSL